MPRDKFLALRYNGSMNSAVWKPGENMTDLRIICNIIFPPDPTAAQAARRNWDSLAKPLGSLGLLEEAIVRIAALTGSAEISLSGKSLLVFCADNGVIARGVTQCGSEVTAAVARALAEGRSSVSPMARLAGCTVVPIDMGIRDFTGHDKVVSCRIRNGTGDISVGPAMTGAECVKAIEAGIRLAQQQKEAGVRLLAIGEMGIGNTTTAAAVAASLLDCSPKDIVGRGAGLSDAGLAQKKQAVADALLLNRPDPSDPVDVLAKVGGLDLAGMCGAFLGAALCHVPVLIDGTISAAAALCAQRLCPTAAGAMIASHLPADPAAKLLLDALGLNPLISAGMRLGEGSGAVAAMPLLDMALAVYNSGQNFEKLGIDPYTRQV